VKENIPPPASSLTSFTGGALCFTGGALCFGSSFFVTPNQLDFAGTEAGAGAGAGAAAAAGAGGGALRCTWGGALCFTGGALCFAAAAPAAFGTNAVAAPGLLCVCIYILIKIVYI
jgi:hypothetical protein